MNNNNFLKKVHFLILKIIYFSITYYNIVIWVNEIIQNVAYDN